ncbi:unnamed protein product [Bursaphelenchus okinawaensis]|uniref:Uncharacterized protein n=1 Tax=Bursaphelenchus okinawaensis TaxID=465554 RepID=A0A811LTV5_9BILA|nr:unnamed protein product [Bursaphelenchus okinawaensis]CAG9127772.1 unnamed protein product [Bursaphelenchus okinawaensis]
MGCNLSPQAQPETARIDNSDNCDNCKPVKEASDGQEESVKTLDYLDGVDISRVNQIDIYLHGNSTELDVEGSTTGTKSTTIKLCDEYDVIMEKLTLCLKRERSFSLQIELSDECVWSPFLLHVMAEFFLYTLPSVNLKIRMMHPGNMYIPFIGFPMKLLPIVERLIIDDPIILWFFFDLFPLKHAKLDDVNFENLSMLEKLCLQNIIMPNVRFVTVFIHQSKAVGSKLVLENACNLFPSMVQLKLNFKVTVSEESEPIMNHELFTYAGAVLDTFESMLDWNQGKHDVFIDFQAVYKGSVIENLARKMTEYIGYECSYDDGKLCLDIHQSNVGLEMCVMHQ